MWQYAFKIVLSAIILASVSEGVMLIYPTFTLSVAWVGDNSTKIGNDKNVILKRCWIAVGNLTYRASFFSTIQLFPLNKDFLVVTYQ